MVCSFLAEVAAESTVNNMDVENLARVFAPTLFRSPAALSSDPMVAFAEVSVQKTLLQHMITQAMRPTDVLDVSSLKLSDKMMSRMQDRSIKYAASSESQDDRDSESSGHAAGGKAETCDIP